MSESTPNVHIRTVQYTMQNDTEVTQRRSYLVDENNKWRQIKNMEAWTMIEDTIDSYADLMPTETEYSPKHLTAESDSDVSDNPLYEGKYFVQNDKAVNTNSPTVPAKATGNVVPITASHANQESFRKRHPRIVKALGAVASVLALSGVASSVFNSNSSESVGASAAPAAVALEQESTTTTVEANITTTEATPSLTEEQLQAKYGNVVSGERTHNTIGNISINPNDPEGSIEALYNDLRHNPDALAFWNACLSSGTPSYDVCVATPATLQSAHEMALRLRAMDISHKATVAETVISQFEKAQFDGISIDNGEYKTVGIHADGSYFAMTNTRFDDPRLNFTFTGKDGLDYKVQLRNCVQLTEGETPSEPVAPPVVVETPPTTVPEEPPTTTTTVPETTTTTEPEETTTSTSTTSTSTTSTTVPTTTTVPVTVPKTTPTYPDGEVTTTVTAGDPTPEEPTTSTVPESTTQPTAPADTAVSTTAPEIPVDNPPVNSNSIFPFGFLMAGGGLATLSLPAFERRKREKAARKKS